MTENHSLLSPTPLVLPSFQDLIRVFVLSSKWVGEEEAFALFLCRRFIGVLVVVGVHLSTRQN